MEATLTTSRTFLTVGPPGTGKTTYVVRQCQNAVNRWCEETREAPQTCRDVLITTLTRAAASELRSRGLEIGPNQIGTLHSHAYRSLGFPRLCVNKTETDEFNRWVEDPAFHISPCGESRGEPGERKYAQHGDRLREQYFVCRAQLQARKIWPEPVLVFAKRYEMWKSLCGYRDFSDCIDDAYEEVDHAPGNPRVIFVDEAQDHDRSELRLIRKWSEQCETLVLVGDPLQNLYQWRGSEPRLLEENIPQENVRVLSRSYRVPRAVHQFAMSVADRVSDKQDFAYQPREFDGEVRRLDMPMQHRWIGDILTDADEKYLQHGKSVMFLASCGYMLTSLIGLLRERGIPYWNPFSRSNGAFNPLTPACGMGVGQRLLNYLRPREDIYGTESRVWTPHELYSWMQWLRIRQLLISGKGTELKRRANAGNEAHYPLSADYVQSLFANPEDYESLAESISMRWLLSRAKKDHKRKLEYATKIFETRGRKGLEETPRVIVGTIHSVKGGEADVVYVSPELSPKFWDAYESGTTRDQITRMFYVAATRARETLVLCSEGQRTFCFEW